jgi:hypothetical protein
MAAYAFVILMPLLLGALIYRARDMQLLVGDRAIPFGAPLRNRVFLIAAFTVLMFVSVFRAERMGTDYSVYLRYYRDDLEWYNANEPLFKWILRASNAVFHGEAAGLALVVTGVYFIGVASLLLDNVGGWELFFCVMIFVLNPYMYMLITFNAMRQALATGIILLGVRFIRDSKWIVFTLFILIAAQIHYTLLSLLALLPLLLIPWNRVVHFIVAGAAFLFSAFVMDLRLLMDKLSFIPGSFLLGWGEGTKFDFLLYKIFILIVAIAVLRWYDRLYTSRREKFFVDLFLLSLCLLQLAVKNDSLYRVYSIVSTAALPAAAILMRGVGRISPRVRRWLPIPVLGYYALKMALFFATLQNNASHLTDWQSFAFIWM